MSRTIWTPVIYESPAPIVALGHDAVAPDFAHVTRNLSAIWAETPSISLSALKIGENFSGF